MEEQATGIIQQLIAMFPSLEILTKIVVGWFLAEKTLRLLAKWTPWQWDDDLINIVSDVLKPLLPKKKSKE